MTSIGEATHSPIHQSPKEATMQVKEVTVLMCKKVSRNFQSWTVSHGATAEVGDDEDYRDALRTLRTQLACLVNEGLNGRPNRPLIAA